MINLILTLTNLILLVKLTEAIERFEELNAQYRFMKESGVERKVKDICVCVGAVFPTCNTFPFFCMP